MKASKRYPNLNGTVVSEDHIVLSSIRLSDHNTVYAATRYMVSGSGKLSEDHQGAVYSGHGLIRTSVSMNDPPDWKEQPDLHQLTLHPLIHTRRFYPLALAALASWLRFRTSRLR